ncbi:N-acetylmuramoyl-L-alanine amidase [Brevibacillus choshinensis]|uniref:N-acetylmuramoyl-L-alanine amidase n=1 Tax=Brevibacillus choshinensis TaxID=54911 RepID=A0ABR5N8B8_BRECH|nr:N-acetylmuramoyl-L-alanine amidase [Brevibacillus choshinensis]KQL46865.1 N-acetylmuramoyl-L-alanine amidase [Brevibacillus choshinensis]
MFLLKSWGKVLLPLTISSLLVGGYLSPLPSQAPVFSISVAHAEEESSTSLQQAFEQASEEFDVPLGILLSVSYNITNWENHSGSPSFSGGYGIMHLSTNTLKSAAALLDRKADELKKDPVQNIRGAAAVLAQYAQDTTGHVPKNEEDWYGAVAKYSATDRKASALEFADQVYQTINEGVERETSEGQILQLVAKDVEPNTDTAEKVTFAKTTSEKQSTPKPECPKGLDCDFIEAPYVQLEGSDYSNHDISNRPRKGPAINYIVIHNTEETYDDTIKIFTDPLRYVSAHYVIRSKDGHVTQMLKNKDVGWHAGNWYFNSTSIGIEHEGYAIEGANWYTENMYRSSAKLVRYLAREYDIPLDRNHIIGHDEVPGMKPANQSKMHEDPGPFWDWDHYMELMNAPIKDKKKSKKIITIKPDFKHNRPEMTDLKAQPSNFLYLRTAPDNDAPLIIDAAVKPDRDETDPLNWANKAVTGRTFYLADHEDDWDAIWFGGQKAWFYNPSGKNTVAGKGILVTPKKGKDSIPVYGQAYPNPEDYPKGEEPQTVTPLQYTIEKGQVYVAAEKVKSSVFLAPVYVLDPKENIVVIGKEQFYQINFNHRLAFVKVADVDVVKE